MNDIIANTNSQSEFLLSEKYRPEKIDDCILPARIKDLFEGYAKKKEVPNLILSGGPGTGKTTIAKALCSQIGLSYLVINSSDERGIDTFRTKIKNYASTLSFKGGRKVIILDEADYLTPESQAALRGAMEEFSKGCTFILTCNFKNKLMDAIKSRTTEINFDLKKEEMSAMAFQFTSRMQKVLTLENIPYEAKAVAELVKRFFPDFRRTINEIQRVSSLGSISIANIIDMSEVKYISELFGYLKVQDFDSMRSWVVSNSDVEYSRLYRKIYEGLDKYSEQNSIPQAIVILAKYQYQSSFVANIELNLMACLTEMMIDCKFI